MGTTPADLAIIAETTSYVMADEGDTAWSTARGVFACIEHAAARLGSDVGDLHVAIQGVGKVGMSLAEQLHAVGARLTVADTDERATERAGAVLGAGVVSPNVIHRVEADVFAPCAMGGVLHAGTISELSCRIVAGSANNPLADEVADARRLEDHGIVYVPDIVASMGGVLAAAQGSNEDGSQHDPRAHIHSVLDRLAEVVEPSRQEAAVALAQQRIDERRELRQAFLAAS